MRKLLRLVAVLLLAGVAWLMFVVMAPVRPAATTSVLLHPGWSSRRIAAELRNAGVIRSSSAFLLLHYLRVRPLKAGEYLFERPATLTEIYERIARGDIYFHVVVIPEGFNQYDVAAAIEASGLATRAEFLQQARGDTALVNDLDPQARSLEGYLFPDSYRFT